MYCLIFANGALIPGLLVQAEIDNALQQMPPPLIIAADGGARHAEALGLVPDVLVGDLDSLSAEEVARYEAGGVEIIRYPVAKDATDLELALRYAVEHGAAALRLFGLLGSRLDQTMANVALLNLPELAALDVRLVDGKQEAWLLRPGANVITGAPGDTLSLLPLSGAAQGITTRGLEYALQGETLEFPSSRGVSNVLAVAEAEVYLREGILLAVRTLGKA